MRTTIMRRGGIVTIAFSLAACTSNEASSRSLPADSVRADSAGAGRADSAANNRMTDENVLATLDAANIADSASGSEAATKATSADVKQYGRMMMKDHHEMRIKLQDAARQQNLTPAPPSRDPLATAADSQRTALAGAQGRGWDSTYLAHAANMHASLLGWIAEVEAQGRSEELRALLNEAKSGVGKHLDRAQTLLSKYTTPQQESRK
jgi:putative membrane protein